MATIAFQGNLAGIMRKIKIGLALGSGAARGWSHIGVIKALKHMGIDVDIVAGAPSVRWLALPTPAISCLLSKSGSVLSAIGMFCG